jgi:hypothetical protein
MLYAVVASVGDIFMNWRQLKGIKRRAERRAAAGPDVGAGEQSTARSPS